MLAETLGGDLSEEAARYLEVIRRSTQQMGRLIDDLLSLSRVGRKTLDEQEVNMDALVDDVLVDLGGEIEGRDLSVSRQPLPPVWGDPGLLRQVWANLISNAVKFTRTTVGARIEIGARTDDDGRNIYYVKDNGVGFDMKYAGKLFGVFQRLHRPEQFEGTGVGLALVQRIVSRHGGSAWAEAYPNLGATFYFTVGGGRR
jgi:light-regulated signal transduction histidine kinase (bacteriophytochrome)